MPRGKVLYIVGKGLKFHYQLVNRPSSVHELFLMLHNCTAPSDGCPFQKALNANYDRRKASGSSSFHLWSVYALVLDVCQFERHAMCDHLA